MVEKPVNEFKTESDFEKYAVQLAEKITASNKPSKLHCVFLKNLNDLLCQCLDEALLKELKKELNEQYNNKLDKNKKNTNKEKKQTLFITKSSNQKDEIYEDIDYDYNEEDEYYDEEYEEQTIDSKKKK